MLYPSPSPPPPLPLPSTHHTVPLLTGAYTCIVFDYNIKTGPYLTTPCSLKRGGTSSTCSTVGQSHFCFSSNDSGYCLPYNYGGAEVECTLSFLYFSTMSGASPYYPTTPPRSSTTSQITVASTVQETRDWLAVNRFAPYTSLFANYTGADLLRLNRRDFMDLCGAADGIRLFNALRSRTVQVIYICMGREKSMFLIT